MIDLIFKLTEAHEVLEQAEKDLAVARRDYSEAAREAFRVVSQTQDNTGPICFAFDGYAIKFDCLDENFTPGSVTILPLANLEEGEF